MEWELISRSCTPIDSPACCVSDILMALLGLLCLLTHSTLVGYLGSRGERRFIYIDTYVGCMSAVLVVHGDHYACVPVRRPVSWLGIDTF